MEILSFYFDLFSIRFGLRKNIKGKTRKTNPSNELMILYYRTHGYSN